MATQKELKPLNSVERRELNKLIEAEFELINLSIAEMADQELKREEERVEEEFSHVMNMRPEIEDHVKQMLRDFQDTFDEYVRSVEKDYGLRVRSGRFGQTNIISDSRINIEEPQALKDRKKELQMENGRKINEARRLVQRQKLDMQKKVTLAGLTSEAAQEYIGEIPSADQIFSNVKELTA